MDSRSTTSTDSAAIDYDSMQRKNVRNAFSNELAAWKYQRALKRGHIVFSLRELVYLMQKDAKKDSEGETHVLPISFVAQQLFENLQKHNDLWALVWMETRTGVVVVLRKRR
jgi:hypothetical protein